MTGVKICEKGHRIEEAWKYMRCPECGANMDNATEENNSDTELSPPKPPQPSDITLTFLTSCDRQLQARDGDIIGREAVGAQLQQLEDWSNYLDQFLTVSRRHIKVFTRNGEWWLKNLSDDRPTSSTCLNDQAIPQNEERKLEMGHILELGYEFESHTKCRLKVMP